MHSRSEGFTSCAAKRVKLACIARPVFLLCLAALLAASPSAYATSLVITPTFDSTITNDTNATAIEGSINSVIAKYESIFADSINVTIDFKEGGGLGTNSTFTIPTRYIDYYMALSNDKTSASDIEALAHIAPVNGNNPVDGQVFINVKTANLRAIGLPGNPGAGNFDGIITLNTGLTNPGSSNSTGDYVLQMIVAHEINEVLGLGSALGTNLAGTLPEDLFRYGTTSGTRSFTKTSAQAFFSIDGTTHLAQFNNPDFSVCSSGTCGDYGDWASNPLPIGVLAEIQDAFATPHANPALGVELTALDVIGYDSVTPEPTTMVLLGVGLVLIGAKHRLFVPSIRND